MDYAGQQGIFQERRRPGRLIGHLGCPPRPFPQSGHPVLAKKPNYDFEKRKKEQERAKKKEAKRAERLARRQAGGTSEGDPDLEGIVMGPQNVEPTGEVPVV